MARTDGLGGRRRTADVAAQGVAGSGERLPFLDVIQASFGAGHDLSGIEAHVGGEAGEAAAEIDAEAYAMGDHVAFQEAPDLFTAAHEAAHVVQQQDGVQLLGGVGEDGDAYEQHADAVAERVVRGASAADLLVGHGGGGMPAVQRSSIRAAAKAKLAAIKADVDANNQIPGEEAVASDGPNGIYAKHVGLRHKDLTNNWNGAKLFAQYSAIPEADRNQEQRDFLEGWRTGSISHSPTLTGCNNFTGKYAGDLKLQGKLGVFTLQEDFPGTFVTAQVGRYPKEGDIVKSKQVPTGNGYDRLHVCVSYSAPKAEGDSWTVIDAGQGGPDGKGSGREWFKIHSKPYDSNDIEGWIDIDLQADDPARQALAGSWEVELDGDTWLYTFPTAGNVVRYEGITDPTLQGEGAWSLVGDQVVFAWKGGTPESWPLSLVKGGGDGTKLRKFNNGNALLGYLVNKKFDVTIAPDTWRYTFSAPNRVRYEHKQNKTDHGGGTWMSSGRHIAIRWDGGTEEHWDVPTGMNDFGGTQTPPGGKATPCNVHPTF